MALSLFISCARQTEPPVIGKLLSVTVDPESGFVSSVSMAIYNTSPRAQEIDYAMEVGKHIGYWRPPTQAPLNAHARRDVVLSPERGTFLPIVGDAVLVLATDKATSRTVVLAAFTVEGSTRSIVNPLFKAWDDAEHAPRGWAVVADAGTNVQVSRGLFQGKAVLEIRAANRAPGLHYAFIQQKATLDRLSFSADLYVDDGCIPQTKGGPTRIVGIQIADDAGNSIIYCASPRVRSTILRAPSTMQLVYIKPSRPKSWSSITIRPASLRDFLRLHGDRRGLINVRVFLQFYGRASLVVGGLRSQ